MDGLGVLCAKAPKLLSRLSFCGLIGNSSMEDIVWSMFARLSHMLLQG
jgi:hypothetical protein